jgi:hypothetical protein
MCSECAPVPPGSSMMVRGLSCVVPVRSIVCPETRDVRRAAHDTAGQVRAIVDELLIDPIDAVVFAVGGVLEAAGDQHRVLRRDLVQQEANSDC